MKNIILKSIFAIFVYLSIASFSNLAPIKESFDDFAFDNLVTDYLNVYESKFDLLKEEEMPRTNVFLIEDDYLNYYKLKDYGYVFPRKEMAGIVESLNFTIEEMKTPPKGVFIDYDLHYTELPYGRKLSSNDKFLIDELLKLASTTVVMIPKAKKFHFIENYLKQNNVKSENIIFVSPNFLLGDDLLSRRFQSYYKTDDSIYPNVDYLMYLLSSNKCKSAKEIRSLSENNNSISLCGETLKKFDVTENRMIPKLFSKNENNLYNYGYTLWDKNSSIQKIRSISTLVEESIVPSSLEDSIIMIGGDFTGNHDKIGIAHTKSADTVKLPGIILHLNTLNSFFFFDGTLKNINPIYGSIIVFIVFFIFSYFEEKNDKMNRFVEFIFNATMMTIVLIIISLVLILHYKLWFNWFAPLFTYQALEFIYKIRETIPKIIELKNKLKKIKKVN